MRGSENTHSIAKAVKDKGESWFYLTTDYMFGQALERDSRSIVTAAGAKALNKTSARNHSIST